MSEGYLDTRKEIRDNLISLLNGKTLAGSDVFSSRATPIYESELQCINIYTPEDIPKLSQKFNHKFEREVLVLIEILVHRNSSSLKPEDKADIIAGQIENRLLPNNYLQYPPPKVLQQADEGDPGSEIVNYFSLMKMGMSKTAAGSKDLYGIVMEFRTEYSYVVYINDGNITPFEKAGVHYNLNGDQAAADQAEDLIELPQ